MKRILFYYDNFCGERAKGGTEVATRRIASALKATGEWEVYNAFRNRLPKEPDSLYKEVVKLSKTPSKFKDSLGKFLKERDIDVVVNMSRFFRHPLIMDAIGKSGRDVKIVFMQHFAPGSEKKKGTYRAGYHLLKLNPLNPLYWLRATLYPLLKLPRTLRWKKIYKRVYDLSDRVVLLSEGYIEPYQRIAGIKENSKFVSIPNIYDRNEGMSSKNRGEWNKEKRVLVLSRMDEVQKRISLALQVWQLIEREPDLSDWQLDIVGTGHDMAAIKRLCSGLGLKNVTFHGWQESVPFLKRSAVLMMTSEYEGLPLSILEARSYGCVPIAYNAYASLKDVVTDGETGIIVDEFGDVDGYAGKLMALMRDDDKRNRMARNSVSGFEKFSSANIALKWKEMLDQIR